MDKYEISERDAKIGNHNVKVQAMMREVQMQHSGLTQLEAKEYAELILARQAAPFEFCGKGHPRKNGTPTCPVCNRS